MIVRGENITSIYQFWGNYRQECSNVGYDTLIKYFQFVKDDIAFKPSCFNSLSEKDFLDVLEFCKKPKYDRMRLIYIFTCSKKYGSGYFKEHAAKGRETKKKKYGDDFDKLMMARAKESGLKKNPDMIQDACKKAYQTKLERYGKEWLSDVARKNAYAAIETKKKKYGNDYFVKNAECCKPKIQKTKMERYGTLFPREYSKKSKGEKEVVNFIREIYSGEIQENVFGILKDDEFKELDIYIPEFNLAIEYDGWFYHSEGVLMFKSSDSEYDKRIKELKYYHQKKTECCLKQGIRLIHILDILWNNYQKREIYKSIISSALNIYDSRHFARKLNFCEISSSEARLFFDENHIQGFASSSKYFALKSGNDIIQAMSFRLISTHDKNECELNRMVTLKNNCVVGGFSKLLKNSLTALNLNSCISYVDLSVFDGKGYDKIGFEVISKVEPTYYYIFKEKIHRREFGMRKNIEKLHNEGLLPYWNSDETEEINMQKNKVPRLWDCGKLKVKFSVG